MTLSAKYTIGDNLSKVSSLNAEKGGGEEVMRYVLPSDRVQCRVYDNKPAKLRHCSLYRTCPSSIGNRMCL